MRAPLDELRELVEEADGLPAAMPEAATLQVRGCRVTPLQWKAASQASFYQLCGMGA
jgi:hypothetical protein